MLTISGFGEALGASQAPLGASGRAVLSTWKVVLAT